MSANNQMSFHVLQRLNLRLLILSLALLSVLITLGNSFCATYQVQRDLLINNTLEANRAYSAKLAKDTDNFFAVAQSQLQYSADLIAAHMDDESYLQTEATRLHKQNALFDSVFIVNADATIVAASPSVLNLKGRQLSTPDAIEAFHAQKPIISNPFISPVGNYLISISHPIFSADGHYLGYVAGTIYLQENGILGNLLGQHYYQDGTYVYVVDQSGVLLYHQDPNRIGEKVTVNGFLQAVIKQQSGEAEITNSRGIDMLAGYAPIARTGWSVVAQRPKAVTLTKLEEQIQVFSVKTLPLTLITLVFIWVSALLIARPLKELANNARVLDQKQAQDRIQSISSWYFESALLKSAILKGVGLLNEKISRLQADSHTDPMTGLYNRRGMQKVLDYYQDVKQDFAVISLDIDHFKQINDRYGHDVGDQVIQSLAQLMRHNSRKDDALCRSGGEEFLIFLPNTTVEIAERIAERLRQNVAQHKMTERFCITISLGVVQCQIDTTSPKDALKFADNALYQAKRNGRNQVVKAA
ncbi:sensor domain-containing diguanylate cyclase [Photobacterium sp. TY1-4]|uniref:sensor domain-containing diguanylate cyclase n=1 Tax=Photobacterium sp. TY1-4 TaxID=2899122 RepID=UPI0021C13BA7|nr:sensor domain-containing diguanylate cyclase [Photobacterium sp. TY1-4]UXH99985.1 sensor domain-containing diguanylate cyclase [Photobacterium sp. TY1-4]